MHALSPLLSLYIYDFSSKSNSFVYIAFKTASLYFTESLPSFMNINKLPRYLIFLFLSLSAGNCQKDDKTLISYTVAFNIST